MLVQVHHFEIMVKIKLVNTPKDIQSLPFNIFLYFTSNILTSAIKDLNFIFKKFPMNKVNIVILLRV